MCNKKNKIEQNSRDKNSRRMKCQVTTAPYLAVVNAGDNMVSEYSEFLDNRLKKS